MSDDDFMMDSGGEDEDYDFQYEDDEEEGGGDVDIENKYYNAKQIKTERSKRSHTGVSRGRELGTRKRGLVRESYQTLPLHREGTADNLDCRGFKGLKQAIKLEFKLKEYDQVGQYTQMES